MYLINPQLSSNLITNDGLNNLLDSIDSKILSMATCEYYNTVYGFQHYVDIDKYEKICDYREILIDKLMGCNCLENQFFIYITSRIQKLINTF